MSGDDGYAPNVIVALLRVMRDLPAIGKDQTASSQQGGYAYRGIEQITAQTQALFAKHGVLFGLPRVVSYEIRAIEVNGKPWTDTVEQVEYDIYGPGGVEDKVTVGPILAIGRDNSDKGGNKCLTQAYKYALIQALNIADAKDDGDAATHEADRRQESPFISPENVERFKARCAEVGVDPADVVASVTNHRTESPAELLKAEVGAAKSEMERLAAGPGEPEQPTLVAVDQ